MCDNLLWHAVNYLHWGAPKQWYGVPAAAAVAFEAAFQAALPRQFEQAPDLLFHLVTMLAPRTLQQHDVPVYGITQVWEVVQDPSKVSTERHQGATDSKQGPQIPPKSTLLIAAYSTLIRGRIAWVRSHKAIHSEWGRPQRHKHPTTITH